MNKKKRVMLGLLTVLLIGLLFFRTNKLQENVVAQPTIQYPRMWTKLGLPVVPNGNVTQFSSDGFPEDGIEIEIDVNQTVSEVGSFFEKEMGDRNFDYDDSAKSGEDAYSNGFSSGDVNIDIDVSSNPNEAGRSKVKIVIRTDPRRTTKARRASLTMD